MIVDRVGGADGGFLIKKLHFMYLHNVNNLVTKIAIYTIKTHHLTAKIQVEFNGKNFIW